VLGSAAVKAVFLIEAALLVQPPAPRVEIALLFIEAMLLVPIGPLAFVLAPISVAVRGRRRLAIQGSADPLHNIARGFRVRRNCAQRNDRTNGQYSKSNHCNPPFGS